MIRPGLHFHGTDFDPNAVPNAALDLGLQSFTVLDLDRELISPILRRYPTAHIHVRQWAMVTDDPEGRADQAIPYISELLSRYPSAHFAFSSANEWDIESFGGHMTQQRFEQVGNYQRRWALRIRARLGEAPFLLVAAPSPGHDEDGPDELVGYNILYLYVVGLFDGLAAHLYIDPPDQDANLEMWLRYRPWRPVGYKNSGDPGGMYHITADWKDPRGQVMPIWVTECNVTNARAPGVAARVASFLARIAELDVDRRIIGPDWFVWDSPDPAFETMRMCAAPALWPVWKDQEEVVVPEPEVPEFRMGFLALAEEMRSKGDTVEPLANERWLQDVLSIQPVRATFLPTEAIPDGQEIGYFLYAPGGQPIYLPGAQWVQAQHHPKAPGQ